MTIIDRTDGTTYGQGSTAAEAWLEALESIGYRSLDSAELAEAVESLELEA